GDNALSDTTCRDSFRRFKNNDFQLEDKERSGAPKKFQDKELEQLLDEDPSQTLSELGKILQVNESTVSKRLKGLGMIQKQGHWAATPIGHDHRGKRGITASDWLEMGGTGVAKSERRQTWPWNGCGAAFACERRFRRCYCCFCRRCCCWLAAVVTGNRLVVLLPPPPSPPTPPPTTTTPPPPPPPPPQLTSLRLTRYRSHSVAGDERVDRLAKCHRFQGIFTFRAREVCSSSSSSFSFSCSSSSSSSSSSYLFLPRCSLAAPRRFHLAVLSVLLHLRTSPPSFLDTVHCLLPALPFHIHT
ncbi:MOS1T transposase, partial [Pseudoatta argentina]